MTSSGIIPRLELRFFFGGGGGTGFELGVLHMLGVHSPTCAMPSALFCFSYFSDGVLHFCPGPALNLDFPACAQVSQGHHHHTWLVSGGRILLTFS
jgi:hypothetical protein